MKRRRPPARVMPPYPHLPVFGPCVPGQRPFVLPSIFCSWCGSETLERSGVKVCTNCDLSPAKPTP